MTRRTLDVLSVSQQCKGHNVDPLVWTGARNIITKRLRSGATSVYWPCAIAMVTDMMVRTFSGPMMLTWWREDSLASVTEAKRYLQMTNIICSCSCYIHTGDWTKVSYEIRNYLRLESSVTWCSVNSTAKHKVLGSRLPQTCAWKVCLSSSMGRIKTGELPWPPG